MLLIFVLCILIFLVKLVGEEKYVYIDENVYSLLLASAIGYLGGWFIMTAFALATKFLPDDPETATVQQKVLLGITITMVSIGAIIMIAMNVILYWTWGGVNIFMFFTLEPLMLWLPFTSAGRNLCKRMVKKT